MEKILCAAIHWDDKKEHPHQPWNIDRGIVICGRRHHNIFPIFNQTLIDRTSPKVQGFMTSEDRFVDRKEALYIAIESGQVRADGVKKELFSEDLY